MAVASVDLSVEQWDPTFPARQRASQMLNLPYVASLRQLEFHLAEETGLARPVLYGGAMGGGKSAALCAEAIRECIEVKNNRVFMCRKELATFKRTTLQTLLGLLPEFVTHRPSAFMFLFPNGSQLIYGGLGTDKERQKLRSAEYGAIFIDEATEIDRQVFMELSPRLRWKPADDAHRLKLRLTCNPEPGWIKEDFITNPRLNWRYIAALPIDNPYLPADYVEQMRQQLPSDWFKAYMLGDWDAFNPADTVLDARLLERATRQSPVLGDDCVWGVDVARFGKDRTVLCERRGVAFRFMNHWEKQGVPDTVNALVTSYRIAKRKPDMINVDDDGVGGGVTDGLRAAQQDGQLGACKINGVIAQAQARDTVHYANLKSELWFLFKALLESGAPVSIPPRDEQYDAKSDLEVHRYEIKGGKAQVEPKRLVKSRTGRSPDDGDALILCMFTGRQDYVAYESAQEEMERRLAQMSAEERRLYAAEHERTRRARDRVRNFQVRFGVRLLEIDDSDPYDVGY